MAVAWFNRWQNWAIVGLVVTIVAFAAGWVESPWGKKNVGVDLGYILVDGTQVTFEEGKTYTFYFSPQELKFYRDESKTQEISKVWGSLWIEPQSDNAADVQISGTGRLDVTGPASDSFVTSAEYTIVPNQRTHDLFRIEAGMVATAPTGTYTFTFTYNGTGVQGTLSDNYNASGAITAYWEQSTLTLSVGTSTGYLSFK